MDGDPSAPMLWQEQLFATVPGLEQTAALAASVDAAFAAPAPAAAAPPVYKFAPAPPAPLPFRNEFNKLPANKAAARELKAADPERCNQQGLTKEAALVWNQYAGVDANGNITNKEVLAKVIEREQARVDHFTRMQDDPVHGAQGCNTFADDLRKANLALAKWNKMNGVVPVRGRPVGSGSGGGIAGGAVSKAARTGGVRFGAGRLRANPSLAGQRAPVSKTVRLAPGYVRYYLPGTGKPVYVNSTLTVVCKSPPLVMPAAQRQGLQAAIAEAQAAPAAAPAADPQLFSDDHFAAADGASDAAEAGAGGGVPLFTLPVDADMDEEEEDEAEESEGAAAAAAAAHADQMKRYQRGYELATKQAAATATETDGDDDDGDEEVPAAPAARGAKRGSAPAKAAAAAKTPAKTPAKRTSGAHAAAPNAKRAKRT